MVTLGVLYNEQMTKLKLAVLMGGNNSEREVSLMSGKQVIEALDKDKYEILAVDVPEELSKLDDFKPEVVFIAIHGKGGEDGEMQNFLETKGWKYCGCGVEASQIGMDKLRFRKLMEENGVEMPKLTDQVPCVVKPNDCGSSVGVSIVKTQEELDNAISKAKEYDPEVIIEEYLKGTEVTCGVWGNPTTDPGQVEALPIVEICPVNQFFDYEAKYTDGKCQEICPARISPEMTKIIQELSIKVFNIIGGRGFGRVDFIIKDGVPYVLEINTIPGLTSNSLFPREAKAAGYSYSQMLDKMIELALE